MTPSSLFFPCPVWHLQNSRLSHCYAYPLGSQFCFHIFSYFAVGFFCGPRGQPKAVIHPPPRLSRMRRSLPPSRREAAGALLNIARPPLPWETRYRHCHRWRIDRGNKLGHRSWLASRRPAIPSAPTFLPSLRGPPSPSKGSLHGYPPSRVSPVCQPFNRKGGGREVDQGSDH